MRASGSNASCCCGCCCRGSCSVGEPVATTIDETVALLRRLLGGFPERPAVLCELLEVPRTALVSLASALTPRVMQARAIAAGVLRVDEATSEDEGPIKPGHENCSTCGTGIYRQQRLMWLARSQEARPRPHPLEVPPAKGRKQGKCGICFEDFEKEGDAISMIHESGHGHFFHTGCIQLWFNQCEKKPGTLLRYTCPLCSLEVIE